jgi:hypothetical protein
VSLKAMETSELPACSTQVPRLADKSVEVLGFSDSRLSMSLPYVEIGFLCNKCLTPSPRQRHEAETHQSQFLHYFGEIPTASD